MAFYNMEPFGPERDAIHTGIIASTIANVNPRKGANALSAEDFMPKFGTEQHKKMTPAEMMGAFRQNTKTK